MDAERVRTLAVKSPLETELAIHRRAAELLKEAVPPKARYAAIQVMAAERLPVEVARCTVERPMRADGLAGVVRGDTVRTTVADDRHQRAADLVNRNFAAERPNRTWVADFTHVAAWCGWFTSRSSSTCTPAPSSAGQRPPPTVTSRGSWSKLAASLRF